MQQSALVTVVTDTARCAGHARCAAVAPEIFELDDNGYNVAAKRQIPVAQTALAQRAARACPERAIAVHGPAAGQQEV